jgi:thiol:disulfide interchange protein DsbD
LATVLATPCTAPFLGVALAFAFLQPPAVVLLFFLMAGLGLAAPFVVLCWRPGWMKWLPKPGVWMERFKVAMGFPMLATAVWLFWFTAPRYGKSGVLWLGLFLVMLAFVAWIWGTFVQRTAHRRGAAAAFALIVLLTGYFLLLERQLHWREPAVLSSGSVASQGGIPWQPWSPEAVAQARKSGRPVLVDFTADNCLNCQLNKATSLEIPSTRQKLETVNAVAFLADFTDHDPRMAEGLRRFDRPGVPLVLVYPPDLEAEPIVLPPILTPGIVHQALDDAVAKSPG